MAHRTGGFYRPETVSENDVQPRKRQRRENDSTETYKASHHLMKSHYRDIGRSNPKHWTQSYRPNRSHSNPADSESRQLNIKSNERSYPQQDLPKFDQTNESKTMSKRNHKSKKDRKENPSSRIHSLKNLIKRRTLPPPIQAEKERELSALLYEREKKNLKMESKRNLERYHFVRFMEKQKAQRTIKLLRKMESNGIEEDNEGRNVKERLREAEIDLNYTIYAPLGEKYISIFAEQRKGKQVSKAEKYKGNWKLFTPIERQYLDQNQLDELQKASMDAANVLEIFGNVPDDAGKAGEIEISKPPIWYEIKAAMEEEGSGKLDAIRDRVRGPASSQGLVVGLKAGDKRKLDWIDDNGEIDPADLDSDSDANMPDADSRTKTARTVTSKIGNNSDIHLNDSNDDDDNDDDMSDGDGGFFEKR